MIIVRDLKEMQEIADDYRLAGKTIGFVPTMGYLHEGHLSLIRLTRPDCDILVVSIFVNPAQFDPNEDLDKYPRNFERDEELCKKEKVDVIFYPDKIVMYPDKYLTYVNVERLSDIMCGKSRPSHFKGVTTVVSKLFNIVKPHIAAFGQKDYQQLAIIKKMVEDLNLDIRIMEGPTVREPDGLAMSSRNKYLAFENRKTALVLYKSLQLAKELVNEGETSATVIKQEMTSLITQTGKIDIDYITIADGKTLQELEFIQKHTVIALAAKVGQARLIDNIILHK
jgi:pantoate--beta-alanine ligase